VVEGTDSFSNIIASVYYPDGETAKDLALELVENVLTNIPALFNKNSGLNLYWKMLNIFLH
jgi:hypothetical protein